MAAKSKKSDTKRYANPVTCSYVEADMQAPIDKAPESAMAVKATETASEGFMTEAEYQDYPKAVKESLERPDTPEMTVNEELNNTYPWCLLSLTGPQRAILCELIRIRRALEAK